MNGSIILRFPGIGSKIKNTFFLPKHIKKWYHILMLLETDTEFCREMFYIFSKNTDIHLLVLVHVGDDGGVVHRATAGCPTHPRV